jgi:hypothetical protein
MQSIHNIESVTHKPRNKGKITKINTLNANGYLNIKREQAAGSPKQGSPINYTRDVCSPHRLECTINQDGLAPERRDKKQNSPISIKGSVIPFPRYQGGEKDQETKAGDSLPVLRLKPQSELPPPPVLTHSIQKPRNGFLL